jgi:STE24 endopeptidase
MINFVKSLTVFQVIIINLGLLSINLLFVLLLKHLVERKYEKTQSVEETLYFQMKVGKYVQPILMCATAFICAFTITPKAKGLGNITGFLLVMAVVIGVMILASVSQQLIMHKLNTALRKTTSTKGEQIKLLLRAFLCIFIPMILLLVVMLLIDDKLHVSKSIENIVKPLLIGGVFLLLSIVMPFFTKYMLKAIPMEEGEIKDELKRFLNQSGLPKTKLYMWPTKKNKVANAMVSGLITKNVYMSDYLLENFDVEESKAVLAHEIGHIKKNHLWIRTALYLGMFVIFPSIGAIFEWYEANYNEIPIWFGMSIFAVMLIGYMGIFLYFIYRVQERQADAYVLELKVNANVYIKALYKLAKLNNMVMKFGKMDERFQTHPSTAKRIKWIIEKSHLTEEDLEEIIGISKN